MKRSELFFNVTRLPTDFVMLLVAGLATYLLRTEILSGFRPVLFELDLPLISYAYLVVFVSLVFIMAYAILGLYSLDTNSGFGGEFIKVLIGSSAGIMVVIIYIFLQQELFNSRFLVLGGWVLGMFFVSVGRIMVRQVQFILVRKYEFGVHRILLIDLNNSGENVKKAFIKNKNDGYKIVKELSQLDLEEIRLSSENDSIDEVVITGASDSRDDIIAFIDHCHFYHIPVRIVAGVYRTPITAHIETELYNGLPLVEFKRAKLDGWGKVAKRIFDITASIIGLIILSPFMAIVALAIKWETEGPVFVHLKRISGKREFNLHKFRSMIDNAHNFNPYLRSLGNDRPEAGPLWKLKNDPRITKTGGFIRRTRIDELPQLWNVFIGEVSLVGPRPHQANEIEKYQNHHKKVLTVKSGVTGLAQVSGSSDISFEREVVLDSFYIDNWSLWLDIKIILRTVFKVVSDRSAV